MIKLSGEALAENDEKHRGRAYEGTCIYLGEILGQHQKAQEELGTQRYLRHLRKGRLGG